MSRKASVFFILVLSHYAGYVRSCAKMDGQINTDMQEHIVRQLIESLLKFHFDR